MMLMTTFTVVWHRSYWEKPIVFKARKLCFESVYQTVETRGGIRLRCTELMHINHEDGERETVRMEFGRGSDQIYLIDHESDTVLS